MSAQPSADLPASGQPNRTLIVLALIEAALLFLGTSSLAGRLVAPYGPSGTSPVQVLLSLIGIAAFVLPSVIGYLCRAWRAAIVLPIAAWWLTLIAHALAASAVSRAAQVPYLYPISVGNDAYTPFWLNSSAIVALLLSFALFGVLGFLGWIVRQALDGER